MPAGTKFIMPLGKFEGNFINPEQEFILFPRHNTFVINNIQISNVDNEKVHIYVGEIRNDLNEYRPKGSPKLRQPLK